MRSGVSGWAGSTAAQLLPRHRCLAQRPARRCSDSVKRLCDCPSAGTGCRHQVHHARRCRRAALLGLLVVWWVRQRSGCCASQPRRWWARRSPARRARYTELFAVLPFGNCRRALHVLKRASASQHRRRRGCGGPTLCVMEEEGGCRTGENPQQQLPASGRAPASARAEPGAVSCALEMRLGLPSLLNDWCLVFSRQLAAADRSRPREDVAERRSRLRFVRSQVWLSRRMDGQEGGALPRAEKRDGPPLKFTRCALRRAAAMTRFLRAGGGDARPGASLLLQARAALHFAAAEVGIFHSHGKRAAGFFPSDCLRAPLILPAAAPGHEPRQRRRRRAWRAAVISVARFSQSRS